MLTYYIAAAHDDNEVDLLAGWLHEHGYRRATGSTQPGVGATHGSDAAALAAARGVCAITTADLFLLLLHRTSDASAHASLGVRLGAGCVAHVVIAPDAGPHIYYDHPLVLRYANVADLLAVVQSALRQRRR